MRNSLKIGKRLQRYLILASSIFILSACGGGGSSSTTTTNISDSNQEQTKQSETTNTQSQNRKIKGYLIDSAVVNARYICGDGQDGFTQEGGYFECNTLPVKFLVGDIELGNLQKDPKGSKVYLEHILPESLPEDKKKEIVEKEAMLLLSLDMDKDPTKSIDLPKDIHKKLKKPIDIKSIDEEELKEIVREILPDIEFVSKDKVEEHLAKTSPIFQDAKDEAKRSSDSESSKKDEDSLATEDSKNDSSNTHLADETTKKEGSDSLKEAVTEKEKDSKSEDTQTGYTNSSSKSKSSNKKDDKHSKTANKSHTQTENSNKVAESKKDDSKESSQSEDKSLAQAKESNQNQNSSKAKESKESQAQNSNQENSNGNNYGYQPANNQKSEKNSKKELYANYPYIPQDENLTYDTTFRFLLKASFGPTKDLIEKVQKQGVIEWLDEQLSVSYDKNDSLTYQLLRMGKTLNDFAYPHEIEEYLAEGTSYLLPTIGSDQVKYRDYFLSSWFREAFTGVKQVHMRVAYALSQIVVASNGSGVFNGQHHALAAYYDVIKKNAFGNYGDLLKEISTNPAMGYYLTFYGNRKKYQNSRGEWVYPDENYAREVMQLFSISPFLLNIDGSRVLDSNGAPIPSYTQDDVNELARVFTGLDFKDAKGSFGNTGIRRADMIHKMSCINSYHDGESKTVLGQIIAGGGDCYQDVDRAIDILINHQNSAPFIAKKLIMRLVKSNPSPEYIQRVAEVFEDNGKGVKGDIKATVRAIYLDKEFWDDIKNGRVVKFKEPIIAFTQMARAFHVKPLPKWHIYLDSPSSTEVRHKKATVEDTDLFWVSNPSGAFGEGPTLSKTVFNFYSDDYIPSDDYFRDNNLVAPEAQIQTDGMLVAYHNYIYNVLFNEKNYALNRDNGVNLYAPYQFVIYKDMKEFGDALDGVFHPDKLYFDLSEYIKAVEDAFRPEMNGKDLEEMLKNAREQGYIFSEEARKKAISNILDILNERLLPHTLDDRLRDVIVDKYYKRLRNNDALSKNFRKFYVLVLQEVVHMVLISDDYKVE